MQNDALKIKKVKDESEREYLDPSRAMEIINTIPPHTITVADDDDLDINATVTRSLLSTEFGGNSQKTYPNPSKENKKKLTDMGFADISWQCLTTEYNPCMPCIPGKPGLYFSDQVFNRDLTPDYQWPEASCRMIGRISSGHWLYMGHYMMEFSSKLTVEEWRGLPEKARKTWIEGYCTRDWGREPRIRIQLRIRPGVDRQFTLAEYTSKLDNTRNTYLKAVTEAQVADALDRGEEALVVWKMACVAYEQEFQRYITQGAPATSAKKSKSKKRKRPSADISEGSLSSSPRPSHGYNTRKRAKVSR
ncbi:hypothetical protein PQX77_005845 [Marasmius sp. AFHP31]|nr:hypothetical protein PQX77_005845 [Marasmius sp. AFHP31]